VCAPLFYYPSWNAQISLRVSPLKRRVVVFFFIVLTFFFFFFFLTESTTIRLSLFNRSRGEV